MDRGHPSDRFAVTIPAARSGLRHVLGGDLPKDEWFTGDAGWLHDVRRSTNGDLHAATWTT